MGDAQSQQLSEVQVPPGFPDVQGLKMPGTLDAPPMPVGPPGSQPLIVNGDTGGKQITESALLAQLVQLLGTRKNQSLLLSDLGALLPGPLRHGVKEKGGLRSWLQKYPNLFQVTGQPGKESVTLWIGQDTGTVAMPMSKHQASSEDLVQSQPEAEPDAGVGMQRDDEEDETQAAVQLRGLPYRATIQDIKAWLGGHREYLKGEGAVQLVHNRDGRPSGFAKVQFVSPTAAKNARDALDKTIMEVSGEVNAASGQAPRRYVEIFLFSERPNKLRFKKATATDSVSVEVPEDAEAAGVSREQVVQECREYMSSPGKGQLLLSMLGVALSPGSRAYLKRMDQGLKHFLSQYAMEFTVEGAKGRECVSYLPALRDGGMHNSDLPHGFPLQHQGPALTAHPSPQPAKRGTDGPSTGNIGELKPIRDFEVPESPKVMPTPGTPKAGFNTPSDWGTPKPQSGLWDLGRHRQHLNAAGLTEAQLAAAAAHAGGPTNGSSRTDGPLDPLDPPYPWLGLQWGMPGAQGVPGYWPPPWQAGGAWMGPPGQEERFDPLTWREGPLPPIEGRHPHGSVGGGSTGGLHQAAVEEEPIGSAVLRLRGLPFQTEEQDVLSFFAKFEVVDHISDQIRAVRMIAKANGKPSGQALVHMRNGRSADIALEVLNGKHIGDRYIEVFRQNEVAANPDQREPGTGSSGSPPPPAAHARHAVQGPKQPFHGVSDTGGSGGPGFGYPRDGLGSPSKDSVATRSSPSPGVKMHAEDLVEKTGAKENGRVREAGAEGPPASKGDPMRGWEDLFDFLTEEGGPGSPKPNRKDDPTKLLSPQSPQTERGAQKPQRQLQSPIRVDHC
mmetsp:Transcript_72640/g.135717  ORF Transcript_72640/g.135717 Transcript_72640/m.135717 type:complete len:839 (-) Transcript_72640:234-2750(-)